ncbi:MAG: hypothetical protein ACR2PL_11895 [Dehalococcoidia bacterium]
MSVDHIHVRAAWLSPLAVLLFAACAHHSSAPNLSPSATNGMAGSANALASGTVAATGSAVAGNTPVAGATFRVGDTAVIVERFRARISAADGVNVRSSAEVKPENRVGSLPAGTIVEVEGQVHAGQEAEPGHGTIWYFLGMQGTTPQFIYGAPGTIERATGAATGTPAASTATGTPLVPPPFPPAGTATSTAQPSPTPTP